VLTQTSVLLLWMLLCASSSATTLALRWTMSLTTTWDREGGEGEEGADDDEEAWDQEHGLDQQQQRGDTAGDYEERKMADDDRMITAAGEARSAICSCK